MHELIIDNFAEIWISSPVYGEQYEINNRGSVRSKLTGKQLKPQLDKKGYMRVRLSANNTKTTAKIHRPVAIAFLPNPNNHPQVNHIDGNKENNSISNLEWVTNYQNMQHAIKNNLISYVENSGRPCKRVMAHDKNTGVLAGVFDSIANAERLTGINRANIVATCKGRKRSSGGYLWSYESGAMEGKQC